MKETALLSVGAVRETILLSPHGGELDGFTLVYADPLKLAALSDARTCSGCARMQCVSRQSSA